MGTEQLAQTTQDSWKVTYILCQNKNIQIQSIQKNTYKTNTDPIFILQKRVIIITTNSNYKGPTNPLFAKVKTLKFNDLQSNSMQVQNKNRQYCIQKLSQIRGNRAGLRGICFWHFFKWEKMQNFNQGSKTHNNLEK